MQTRVLIVDDKNAFRESIQLFLDGFECVFSEAGTGAAALRHLRNHAFDVTFLAGKLPDMAGLDVFREAKSQKLSPGNVIVVTSLPDPVMEAEAQDLGIFRFVEKPLEYEQVRRIFADATPMSRQSIPFEPAATTAVAPTPDEPPIPAKNYRVLVLHEQVDWLNHIRDQLQDHFELIQTINEDEACRWANQDNFHIAVIDRTLARGVSGLEVLSRMRRAHPHLRAIILVDPEEKRLLDPQSAIAYCSKKDLHLLADMINRFLSQPMGRKQVFFSYAKEDRDRVLEIYTELTNQGYLPWMDFKNIVPGREWEPEIFAAIESADYFAYFLSHHSQIKEGAIVQELKRALKKQEGFRGQRRFIIAARLDEVPVDPLLNKFQWADLFGPHAMSQLLDALSASDLLPGPHPNSPTPPPPPPMPQAKPALRFHSGSVRDLIATGESAELEFKSTLHWDLRQQRTNKELEGKIVATIAAFLNMDHGGVLLIGVGDDGTIVGLESDYQTFKNKNRDGFQVYVYQLLLDEYGKDVATLFRVGFESVNDKDVCRITAQPSHKPVYVKGSLYIRTGNSTRALSAQEAVEYSRTRWKS